MQNTDKRTIEVCCGSAADVRAARAGGATRVELCVALPLGGVTPSLGLLTEALALAAGPGAEAPVALNVLIRPREGDFVYAESDVRVMEADIRRCRRLGVHGVVIGALTAEGDVDVPVCRRLMAAAKGQNSEAGEGAPLSVTFHRAFDVCRDPLEALEAVIALGCDRLLTSGQAATAADGIPLLARLVELAGDRLVVMPGCGVTPGNIARIEAATRATEFHSTARGAAQVRPAYVHPAVCFGEGEAVRSTETGVVRKLVER